MAPARSHGYGLDLSLAHGALARVTVDRVRGLVGYDILHHWSKGIGMKSPVEQVDTWVDGLCEVIIQQCPSHTILTDWSVNEAFWGATQAAIQKAYIVGRLSGILMASYTVIHPYPPNLVRTFIELRANSKKSDVHDRFIQLCVAPSLQDKIIKLTHRGKRGEDWLDSIILAYIGAKMFPTGRT